MHAIHNPHAAGSLQGGRGPVLCRRVRVQAVKQAGEPQRSSMHPKRNCTTTHGSEPKHPVWVPCAWLTAAIGIWRWVPTVAGLISAAKRSPPITDFELATVPPQSGGEPNTGETRYSPSVSALTDPTWRKSKKKQSKLLEGWANRPTRVPLLHMITLGWS